MLCEIGVETTPLGLVERSEMAALSEALLDVLKQSDVDDAVATFDEDRRVLGARFLIEAPDLIEAWTSFQSLNFLSAVVIAIKQTLPGSRFPGGTVVEGNAVTLQRFEVGLVAAA